MLVIRFIITCAIPDIPAWLATEMAKIEWARREASRLANTSTPTPEELNAKLIGRYSNEGCNGFIMTYRVVIGPFRHTLCCH